MFNKKAQMSGQGMALVALFIVLMIVGIIQLVSVLTTSKVSGNLREQIPLTVTHITNESVTIAMNTGATNSTLLAQNGFITGSIRVANATDHTDVLVQNTDFKLAFQTGSSGQISNRVNFTTLSNVYNGTALKVSYDTNDENEYHTSADLMRSQNLDSMELGSTAQTILAAGVIIATVVGFILFVRGQ